MGPGERGSLFLVNEMTTGESNCNPMPVYEHLILTHRKKDVNGYVFFFDMVGALLSSVGERTPELLEPYLPNLERCLAWAESNIISEMLTGRPTVDSDSLPGGLERKGFESNYPLSAAQGGRAETATSDVIQRVPIGGAGLVKGWRSNHLGPGGSTAWCTALVSRGIVGSGSHDGVFFTRLIN